MTTTAIYVAAALLGLLGAAPAGGASIPTTSGASDLAGFAEVEFVATFRQAQGQSQGQQGRDGPDGNGRANRGQGPPAQTGRPAAPGAPGNRGQGNQGARGEPQQQPGPAAGPGQGSGGGPGSARPSDNSRSARSADSPGRGNGRAALERRAPDRAAGPNPGAARRRARIDPAELRAYLSELPVDMRTLASSDRTNERMLVGALARGRAFGLDPEALQVRSDGTRLYVTNRAGELMMDLDENRARELGAWETRRLGDRRPNDNAPAFCRSGEGHPVWGRDWCLDQGFGLGSDSGTIWSRGDIDDVIFRRPDERERLDRGGLLDVLGDVVLGRLSLHALSMGLVEPLVGTFVAEPDGPRVLRVRSGEMELAEFVDRDRDDRVEGLYVVQPIW